MKLIKRNTTLIGLILLELATNLSGCSLLQRQTQISEIQVAAGQTAPDTEDSLVIWWEQGYGVDANEAIIQLVEQWEKISGIEVTLKLKPAPLDEQLALAIRQGDTPDIAFNGPISLIIPQLAGTGQLTDVSDVINPIHNTFNPNALAGATYLNQVTGEQSFYAIPTGMVTYNIHYWRPYLEQVGLSNKDIPHDWQGFWAFWKTLRDDLHKAGETNINSFCLTLSGDSHDGKETLAIFLHGNNVEIFDAQGQLVLDHPQNRQGLINTFVQLSSLYKDGYILPGAIDWQNPDDNFQFLDHQCLLVLNGSLSIPSTQKLPDTIYNQAENNRYTNEIVTLPKWPNTTNGSPFKNFIGTQVIVVPARANNPEAAKQFLSYLLQLENFRQWNEQLKGRFIPSLSALLNTPFWQDPNDPHFAAILDMQTETTQPYPQALNPAYADIAEQEVLTGALERIIQENIAPEVVVDEAIDQIKALVNQYGED